MPPLHIIFDFDGTIANTIEKGRIILNSLSEEYGFRQVEASEIPTLRNLKLPELLKTLGIKKLQAPSILAKGSKILKSHIHEIPLIDGIKNILPEVHSISKSCGFLTSNTQENVNLFLRSNGIQEIFSYVSSTSKLSGKAKHLRSICRTFSCRPTDAIYIGDEVRDIKACKKSGVPIIAVSWGYNSRATLEEAQPDYLVDTPNELLNLIKSQFKK